MVEKCVVIIHYLIFKISTLCKAHFCFVYIFMRLVEPENFFSVSDTSAVIFPLVTNDFTNIFGTTL